jgi:hypothetical protein
MMSKADDELTHLLRRAERPVAVEGVFGRLEQRAARLAQKNHPKERSYAGTGSVSQRARELVLTILRSVKR